MKTSRLSLATAVALGLTTASLSANDLLDIRLNDGAWKFIGVNGGFTEASSGDVSAEDLIPSTFDGFASDETDDNNSETVFGFDSTISAEGNNATVEISLLNYTSGSDDENIGSAGLYVESGTAFEYSAKIPEMYVKLPDSTEPDLRIAFQQDYNGETFYIDVNDSTAIYEGTFDDSATQDNPLDLTLISTSPSDKKDENLTIEYVFDRNLSNNPGFEVNTSADKNDYTYSDFNNEIDDDDTLSIFYYNANSNRWETFIKPAGDSLDDVSGDFSELEAGKGYWVKYTGMNTASQNEAGLILGSGTLTSANYSALNLEDGWNMVAMNEATLMRSAGTGLIVELNASSHSNVFTITDFEGTQYFDINTTTHNTGSSQTLTARTINQQINRYKLDGNVSDEFNIVAYPTGTANTIALISDKRFIVKPTNATSISTQSIGAITTLTGGKAWDLNTSSPNVLTAVTGIHNSAQQYASVYDENTLGLETSDENTMAGGLVIYSNVSDDYSGTDSNKTTYNPASGAIGTVSTDIESGLAGEKVTQLDLAFDDGTDDTLLVASTLSWGIEENTSTRTYEIVSSGETGPSTLVIDYNYDANDDGVIDLNDTISFAIGNDDSGDIIATAINGHSKFSAQADHNKTLYVTTTDMNYANFSIYQSEGSSRLKLVTDSTEDNSSGVIKNVYSLENLARATINLNTVEYTVSDVATAYSRDHSDINITGDNNTTFSVHIGFNIPGTGSSALSLSADYNISSGDQSGVTEYANGTKINTPSGEVNVTASGYGNEVNISLAGEDTGEYSTSEIAALIAHGWNLLASIDENLSIRAEATSNVVTITGDFNASRDTNVSRADAGDFTITKETTVIGGSVTLDSLTDDLGHSPIYAGAAVTDVNNPITLLQDATGMKVNKVLSTNEEGDSISWNFADFTKDRDDWFDYADTYTLFSFDEGKGYWVYLDSSSAVEFDSAFDTDDLTVSATYDHIFTQDTNISSNSGTDSDDDMTTVNVISSGSITVDVADLASVTIDRVIANVNGVDLTMTQSGNEYVASYSEYMVGDFDDTETLTVTVFTEDNFAKSLTYSLDTSKPSTPTITVSNLTSADLTADDGNSIYVYSGDINNSDLTGSTYEATVEAGTVNICQYADDFSSNIVEMRFVASNGYSTAPASDIGYIGGDLNATYYPVYKDASILTVTTSELTDGLSDDYDSTCTSTGAATESYGIELSTTGYDVKIAFETPDNPVPLADVAPANIGLTTLEVTTNNLTTEIATIQFDTSKFDSTSDIVLIQYDDVIYSTTTHVLEAAATAGENVALTEDNVTQLSGQTID
jgi:hypothetical protein